MRSRGGVKAQTLVGSEPRSLDCPTHILVPTAVIPNKDFAENWDLVSATYCEKCQISIVIRQESLRGKWQHLGNNFLSSEMYEWVRKVLILQNALMLLSLREGEQQLTDLKYSFIEIWR